MPTTMADSKFMNTSLQEVIITAKSECVCIGDLRKLTLQIILDGWWASMHVSLKRPIVWNNSGLAAS